MRALRRLYDATRGCDDFPPTLTFLDRNALKLTNTATSETLNGRATIRAFGAAGETADRNMTLITENINAWATLMRLTGLQLLLGLGWGF